MHGCHVIGWMLGWLTDWLTLPSECQRWNLHEIQHPQQQQQTNICLCSQFICTIFELRKFIENDRQTEHTHTHLKNSIVKLLPRCGCCWSRRFFLHIMHFHSYLPIFLRTHVELFLRSSRISSFAYHQHRIAHAPASIHIISVFYGVPWIMVFHFSTICRYIFRLNRTKERTNERS